MKLTCQIIVMVLAVLGLLNTLYRDINGRKALMPTGFRGVIITLVTWSLFNLCYWKAGLFSELLPKSL